MMDAMMQQYQKVKKFTHILGYQIWAVTPDASHTETSEFSQRKATSALSYLSARWAPMVMVRVLNINILPSPFPSVRTFGLDG